MERARDERLVSSPPPPSVLSHIDRLRFGTYSSPNPASAGLALEMPGPPRYHDPQLLTLALAAGRLSQFAIDERVRELLTLIDQCAASGVAENAPEETKDTPQAAALLRQLATDGRRL